VRWLYVQGNQKNKRILDQERGAGYWLWKPYIILDVLLRVEEGDIVIYSDSGAEVIADLEPLIDICKSKKGLVFFQVHNQDGTDGGIHLNRKWIKRDCFVLMGADREEYYTGGQVAGSPQLYMRNERNILFLREWLSYCEDPRILTDKPNICGLENLPEFIDHRHDQAVVSILTRKYDIEIFRDPSQFGGNLRTDLSVPDKATPDRIGPGQRQYRNSPYGTLFDLHRTRNFSLTHKIDGVTKRFTKDASRKEALLNDISIGITTFEERFDSYFVPLIASIREFDKNTEIIVVVNGEHNRSFGEAYRKRMMEFLACHERVFPVIFPSFRGVSKLWNTIVIHATHDHILIINDDIVIKKPEAIAKVKLRLRQNGGKSFIINKSWSHFVIAREEIDELGYFDERLLGIGEEDGDFTWRYIDRYGRAIENCRMKEFVNCSDETSYYKPHNIRPIGNTKYSVFNRKYMFSQKYQKDKNGIRGMFDGPVSLKDGGPRQYPNEGFYRIHKKDL